MEAYAVTIQSKTMVTTSLLEPALPKRNLKHQALNKAVRATMHLMKARSPEHSAVSSLARKCVALGIDKEVLYPPSLENVVHVLRASIMHLAKQLKKDALGKWKEKVRNWTGNAAEAHRLIRNDAPRKATVILVQESLSNDPVKVSDALVSYWHRIESWPQGTTHDEVVEDVCDRFYSFLPFVQVHLSLDGKMMALHAKEMKKGAPGVDGWGVDELRRLPWQAWQAFLDILAEMRRKGEHVSETNLMLVRRRSPLEKSTEGAVAGPEGIRPIDVFSTCMRLYSTYMCRALRGWLKEITHKTQLAVHGGALKAVSIFATWVERLQMGMVPTYALTLDMTKMFNMLCAKTCGELAVCAGMTRDTMLALIWPLTESSSVWRLPHISINAFHKNED